MTEDNANKYMAVVNDLASAIKGLKSVELDNSETKDYLQDAMTIDDLQNVRIDLLGKIKEYAKRDQNSVAWFKKYINPLDSK